MLNFTVFFYDTFDATIMRTMAMKYMLWIVKLNKIYFKFELKCGACVSLKNYTIVNWTLTTPCMVLFVYFHWHSKILKKAAKRDQHLCIWGYFNIGSLFTNWSFCDRNVCFLILFLEFDPKVSMQTVCLWAPGSLPEWYFIKPWHCKCV